MSSLFDIGQEFNTLYELASEVEYDSETGEVVDNSEELKELFDGIEGELIDKLDACKYIIKENEAMEKALKDEVERLNKKRSALKNKNERLKELMKTTMIVTGNTKLKGKHSFSVSHKKDWDLSRVPLISVPNDLLKIDRSIKVKDAKDFIKSGGVLYGAVEVEKDTLTIR
jgi:hypothetical protein